VGLISRVTTTGLLALAAGGGYHFLNNRHNSDPPTIFSSAPRKSAPIELVHFAPSENLEGIEIAELRAAAPRLHGPQTPLNIAMYAFTDRAIAQVLIEEADAGAVVRVYRDGEQYASEERDAERYGRSSVTSMFRGHNNVRVRVKPASRIDLMHLKCWSDGHLMRDGSANWSTAGLKRQDNDLRFTTDPLEVREFNRDFEQLWNRPTNIRIQ